MTGVVCLAVWSIVQITRTIYDPARLGAVRISQLDNHCCDLIDRIAPIANHGIDF